MSQNTVYINVTKYLEIMHLLPNNLHLYLDNNNLFFQIKQHKKTKRNQQSCYAYVLVDTNWVKQARDFLKRASIFALLQDQKPYVLKTHKSITPTQYAKSYWGSKHCVHDYTIKQVS